MQVFRHRRQRVPPRFTALYFRFIVVAYILGSKLYSLCVFVRNAVNGSTRKDSSMLIFTSALAPPYHEWDDHKSIHTTRSRLNMSYIHHSFYKSSDSNSYSPYNSEVECKHYYQNTKRFMQESTTNFGVQRPVSLNRSTSLQGSTTTNTTKILTDMGHESSITLEVKQLTYHHNSNGNDVLTDTSQKLKEKSGKSNRVRRMNPSIGTNIRVLVLLVKFKGHENRVVPPKEYFDELLNGNVKSKINPVGSFKQWMRVSSLGRYRVTFDIHDWQVTDKNETEYAGQQSGLIGPVKIQEVFSPILTKVDPVIDWSNGYLDNSNMLNHLMVIHSGYAAEYNNINCIQGAERNSTNRIWSQAGFPGPKAWKSKNSYQLNGFSLNSAFDYPSCSSDGKTFLGAPYANIGIIVHEFSHGFYLPDLYDQDTNDKPLPLGGLSKFAMMSNGYGWNRNGSICGHHDPWSRIKLGWLDPIEITGDGLYSILPSEISGQVYIIKHRFPKGEYLLIENRQPIMWDNDLPKTTNGIVIYHVDELAKGQATRGYPGHPNWPADHYMVGVVQADGRYDIEKGANMGDSTDFWNVAGQKIGPGGSDPNTDSIQNGTRTQTGITITIRSNSSFIMSFEVKGINTTTTTALTNTSLRNIGGDARSTRETVKWILSMLIGAAAMVGVIMIFFA